VHGRIVTAVVAASLLAGCASRTEEVPVEDPVGFDQPGVTAPGAVEPAPDPSPAVSAFPVALTWDGIEILLPSTRTEMIGLHQSNHDGARNLDAVDASGIPVIVMDSRERDTGLRSAADIVVPPGTELRAPVTGTVKRAGTYTLYCDNLDDFLVIEPDGRPGIEVKLLHIDGVQVSAGDRVEAGVTIVAPAPTPLPFESQVDEYSGPDDWPHVHLEVVDTSIPDRPNPNSGSDDC